MKILILTASPVRDALIDSVVADELRRLGNTVWIHPCLREGRDAVLKYKPDVVVVPPIRNPYSRDFVETCKMWGVGVVSRHTEPSCDWDDFKKADGDIKNKLLGGWRYEIDKELVWGKDEAQILNRRGTKFPEIAIGAIGLDIYSQKKLREKLTDYKGFFEKHKLDPKKKTLLIASPWGFADSAPDLHIDDMTDARRDIEGKGRHMAMIEQVCQKLKGKWNILVTIHPGVLLDPYKALAGKLGVPIDSESPMMELVLHCDALIHAGSTAAISSHLLGIPSFQFGDVNSKTNCSWWGRPEATISKVSPYFDNVEDLANSILGSQKKSNANKSVIKNLENGRYGKMDGNAYKRAAKEINEVTGKFKFCWPKAHNDYDQMGVYKYLEKVLQPGSCGICKQPFFIVRQDYVESLCNFLGGKKEKVALIGTQSFCPHCAARFFKK